MSGGPCVDKDPDGSLLSDTLEAAAIKKVLAQFGESEMDLRESASLTLLASMGLRMEECWGSF